MKKFFIYKSSAGSGKTYTLVKEYLKLVLSNPENFRHTLAVTFTNKAAEEMKTRIIDSLVELSQGSNDKLRLQLISEGVVGDIEYKAKDILQRILHNYSYFSVSTIDSFFHKVIRAFAKELKQQLGYNVELDQAMVMDKIVDEVLADIGQEDKEELTKYLEEFVYYSIDDDKGWKIDIKIKDLAGEIFKERYWIKKGNETDSAAKRGNIQKFIGTLFAIVNDFEGKMMKLSESSLKIISDCGLEISNFKNGTVSYFAKLLTRDKYPGDIEPGKTVRKIYNGEDNWYAQKSAKIEQINKAVKLGLSKNLTETIENYDKNFIKYNTAKELIKTVYVIGIFDDLHEKLSKYRGENNTMLISDTNNILQKIISGDNSPFIYEKIGNVYKNYLIDEFQDTSTFQWKNLKPLVENSLSENNFSMIVGDVKQSIYRWRNGNMKLLLEGVRRDLVNFDALIHEEHLLHNFRSQKEIISFNNLFFKNASEKIAERIAEKAAEGIVDGIENGIKDLITNAYLDVQQKDENSESGGYVNVSFISSGDEDYKPKEIAVRKTIEIVKDALKNGFRLKDIMVLLRKNQDASEIAHYLSDAGFKVVSSDSLLLTNSPKVRLLVNLLKFIVDNTNNLAKTEILYNYLICLKGENYNLNDIFNDYKKQTDSLFEKTLPKEFFSDNKLNPFLFTLNLYELAENLIRMFELNTSADAYLLRFLEVVEEYSTDNNTDVSGFISWWEEYKDDYSIIIPEQEDAIRIMTIHKSKGLQSPVVVVPYANWDTDISGTRDLIWVSSDYPPFNESSAFFVRAVKGLKQSYFRKDYTEESVLTNLDNLNMLYVAFTRAMEQLYVLVPEKGSNNYHTGKLIDEVLRSDESLSSSFINQTEFELGRKSKHKSKLEIEDKSYKTDKIISSDFYGKTVIKPLSEEITLEKQKKLAQLKNRGIILHKALSYIKSFNEAEKAVTQLKIDGLITEDNEEELLNELTEILKIREVNLWFNGNYEVKSEAELILPGGEIFRPDRVLIKDNDAIVIDYKTGGERDEHKKQINEYGTALREIGYKDVKKYLFYITERKIIEVQ